VRIRDLVDLRRADLAALSVIALAAMLVWSSTAWAGPKPQLNNSVSSTAAAGEEEEEPSPISVSMTVSTGIGIGSFVSGVQQQTAVSTGFTPLLSYSLGDGISLTTSIGGTWYQVLDYGSSLETDRFLFTDMYFEFGHGSVYSNEDLGLTIGATFRVYLPTSLSSQLQNRILSIRPGLSMSWTFGPVSVSSGLIFTKYFNTNADISLNCETFTDPSQCLEGRGDDPGGIVHGGFESESRAGEIYIPSAGINSFYVGYSVGMGWTILEGLSLSAGVTAYHLFGYKSLAIDEFSSQHARPGRNQTDRLITSIGLSYQVHKNIGLSLGLGTDTARPFGADGKDLVVLDFERAPDNITSLSFGITGSL